MVSTPAPVKNPLKVEAGRVGARRRWGPPRVVRLDELSPEQRSLVLALIAATKKASAAAESADAREEASSGSSNTAAA